MADSADGLLKLRSILVAGGGGNSIEVNGVCVCASDHRGECLIEGMQAIGWAKWMPGTACVSGTTSCNSVMLNPSIRVKDGARTS